MPSEYPLDENWTQHVSTSIPVDELLESIKMTLSELLSKSITSNDKKLHMKSWDYVVLFLFIGLSAVIGLYFAFQARRQKKTDDTEDYLLAGRSLSALPVSLSLTASFMSALTVLGTPVEIYTYGMMFQWNFICYLCVAIMVGTVFIPILYNLKITSAYEYFNLRFNSKFLEIATSICYIVTQVIYMGLVTYAPSLALEQLTNMNLWVAASITAIVCTIYTTLGGLKAVIWTDVFQCCTIMSGFISIVVVGSSNFDGFGNIWKINVAGGRTQFSDFRLDPTIRSTFWGIILGGTFGLWGSIYSCQSMVQRYLACKSVKTAQQAIFYNVIGLWIIGILAGFTGHVAYAYYQFCDPIKANYVNKSDQLIPLLSTKILGHLPGFAGLYAAGVYAGTLSTISSGINAVASVVLQNFILPNTKHLKSSEEFTKSEQALMSKILVFTTGLCILGFSYVASFMGKSVLIASLSAIGTLGGPVVGLNLLGFTCPYADKVSGIIGYFVGIFLALFAYAGLIVDPPRSYEKNVQVKETCLCGISDTSNYLDQIANNTIIKPDCLINKTYIDLHEQTIPTRGFF